MTPLRNLLLAGLMFMTLAPANALTLTDARGEGVDFESFRGKWVFLNYWADWCPGCIEEIPVFNDLTEHPPKQPVAVLAYHYGSESPARKEGLARRFDIRYGLLGKDPAGLLGLGNITALPVTFVFSPQGKLHDVLYGPQTRESLLAVMNAPAAVTAAAH